MAGFVAYQDITDNSVDEYMALVAQKTIQFVTTLPIPHTIACFVH